MFRIYRLEDGEWRATGESYTGTQEECDAYLAQRAAEDGWEYKAEPA